MRTRTLLVIAALVMAAIACNLQRQNEDSPTPIVSPNVERPSVVILEPTEGATVNRGQNVSVKANATGASGVTLVELRVNNLVVDSQVPAESLNPTSLEVLLDYKPEQTGSMVLTVTAYSNNIAGQPAQRTVNVVDSSAGVTRTPGAIAPTPTQYHPICRSRINVGLNFRRGPGVEYDIITTFAAGQEPPIIGYGDRADGRWWQVSWGGQVGWIKESYTTQLGDCSAIRPAVVPASPTPAATKTVQPTQANMTPTPSLPDLILSMLDGPHTVDLDTNNSAEAVYVILVRNNGGQSSGQFNVAVALPNGQTEDLGVIANLGPGQEVQIPAGGLTVEFDSPGIKRLLVTVDSYNNVTESNEGNNQAYLDITVNGGEIVVTFEVTVEGSTGAGGSGVVNPPADAGQTSDTTGGVTAENSGGAGGQVVTNIDGSNVAENPAGAGGEVTTNIDGSNVAEIPAGTGAEQAPLNESGDTSGQPIILMPLDASNVGQASAIATLPGHSGTVDGLAFDPAGTRLASASWDGTIHIWDAATGADLMTLTGHADRVVDVAFSPDGSRLVSAGWDGTALLWDLNTGAAAGTFALGAEVNSVTFSPDGSRLAAGGRSPDGGGLVRVWDVASGSEVGTISTGAMVNDVLLKSDGQLIVATDAGDCDPANSGVGIWDPASGTMVNTLGATGPVAALAMNANEGLIAGSGQDSCSGNGVVWVWGGAGAMINTLDHGSGNRVTNIAFGSGQTLASSSENSTIQLWNARDGQPIGTVPGSGGANSIAFSSDGTLVASGGGDATIRLWGAS